MGEQIPFPKWLLLLFGVSLGALIGGMVGIAVETIIYFPEPPLFWAVWSGIAVWINILSIIIGKHMRGIKW